MPEFSRSQFPSGGCVITLTRGRFALIDIEDLDRLSRWKWSCCKIRDRFYAYRSTRSRRTGTQTRVYMHRQILSALAGQEVDHRDGNGLDNRKQNLRLVTHQQNTFNAKLNTRNRSGYRGVSFDSQRRKWVASIMLNGKTLALGRFKLARDAALAWNIAAKKLMGEFVTLNNL